MDSDQLIAYLLIFGVLAMVFVPMFKSLLEYLIKKPRKVKIESQDIMAEIKKNRLKIAKSQKPRDLRRVTFKGDKDCHGASFTRIKGYIPDTRFTEFFIRLKWYSWFPIWVLVPSRLVENLVSGEVFIKARALRNMGSIYGVVNNQEFAHEEEQIKKEEHEYIDNLLRHEEINHIQEERVNSMIIASTSTSEPYKWVSKGELSADGAEEMEEVD